MIGAMRDGDGGQAIIVVALGAMLLMSALAFVVDWGHGLALRRVSQNEADAAALAAGRLVATSVGADGTFLGSVSTGVVCDEALRHANANATIGVGVPPRLEVSFLDRNGGPIDTVRGSGSSCTGNRDIPDATVYIRVRAETPYSSFFGALLQQQTMAGASARVRITGAAVATPLDPPGAPRHGVSGAASDGPILWPLTRRFNPADFQRQPCGSTCNPATVRPLQFLDTRYGGGSSPFYGLLDLSRTSRFDGTATQLLTSSDQTGPKLSLSPACPAGSWDTSGDATATQCNVANWFGYGFGGMLALDSTWAGQPDQSLSEDRQACLDAEELNSEGTSPYLPLFSCASRSPSVGDWVEIAPGRMSGDSGSADIAARIGELIDARGRETAYSTDTAPATGQPYGKAVVVRIFLWDCAQRYDTGRSRWTLITSGDNGGGDNGGGDNGGGGNNGGGDNGGGDCSQLGQSVRPDRVHLMTVVPFTFYQGLVTSTQIRAYWGDAFSDPGACRLDPQPGSTSCPAVNAAANSAFLVPDD